MILMPEWLQKSLMNAKNSEEFMEFLLMYVFIINFFSIPFLVLVLAFFVKHYIILAIYFSSIITLIVPCCLIKANWIAVEIRSELFRKKFIFIFRLLFALIIYFILNIFSLLVILIDPHPVSFFIILVIDGISPLVVLLLVAGFKKVSGNV